MEGGSRLFLGDVPYVQIIDGTGNNGSKFRVEGKGVGNAEKGYQRGKWICTSGKMPIPWSVLAPTFGYGYLVFARFPNGIPNFPVESFPEGHTYDGSMTFENDGTITSHHEVYWEKGQVVNKVTLRVEGFKPDSPVINFGVGIPEPTVSTSIPTGNNGGRYTTPQAFPIKGAYREYAHSTLITQIKLLGSPRQVKYANTHYIKAEVEQFKDVEDEREHICQHEGLVVFDFSLVEAFNQKK